MRSGQGKIHDILMLGDSNTYAGLNVDGSASYDPSGLDITDSQLLEWRSANHISNQSFSYTIVADSFHPFNLFATAPVSSAINGVGGGMAYMKQMKASGFLKAGECMRITAQGVGGVGLGNGTSPTGAAYAVPGCSQCGTFSTDTANAVTRINSALAQSASLGIVAILWTSGANDAINNVTRANYSSDLPLLIAYLRANITGGSTAPFIMQPLVPGYAPGGTNFPAISLAQGDVAGSVSRCGLVDSSTMVGQTGTGYHLDGTSQRLWGTRAAALALSL